MKNSVQMGITIFTLSLALAFLAGDTAEAQRGGRGMRGGMRSMLINTFQIAQNEKVQEDLELEDDAKEELEKLNDEARETIQEAFQENEGDFEAIGKAMEEVNSKMAKQLEELLSEKQMKRVHEIFIQVNGASVLSDKSVAEMLKLSEKQTAELEKVMTESQDSLREMFGSVDRSEMREKMQEWQEERDEKLMAVLTEEQSKAFEKAKGKSIEIDAMEFRRGGRGGQRGGRGGRGGQRGGDRNGNNQDF